MQMLTYIALNSERQTSMACMIDVHKVYAIKILSHMINTVVYCISCKMKLRHITYTISHMLSSVDSMVVVSIDIFSR